MAASHSFAVFTLEDPDEREVQEIKKYRHQAAQNKRWRQKNRVIRGISSNYHCRPETEEPVKKSLPRKRNIVRQQKNDKATSEVDPPTTVSKTETSTFIEPTKPVSFKKNRLHRQPDQNTRKQVNAPKINLFDSSEPVPPVSSMTFSTTGHVQERRFGVTRDKCAATRSIKPPQRKSPKEKPHNAPILSPYDVGSIEAELSITKLIMNRETLLTELKRSVGQIDEQMPNILSNTATEQEKLGMIKLFTKLDESLADLRDINASIVDDVMTWRQRLQAKSIATSGAASYRPFLWTKVNYLLKMNHDINSLVPTAAFQLLIENPSNSNPMLLRKGNQETTSEMTFLTHVNLCRTSAKGAIAMRVQLLRKALPQLPPPQSSRTKEYQRIQKILLQELKLAEDEKERVRSEKERYQNEHDPFEVIRTIGNIDTILDTYQSSKEDVAPQVKEKLKERQQDTTRIVPAPLATLHGKPMTKLDVNLKRLEKQCEYIAVRANRSHHYAEPPKGKLRGSIVLSRHQVQQVRAGAAVKIWAQYRKFVLRRNILRALASFVTHLNGSAVRIQKIARGYMLRNMLKYRALVAEQRRVREKAAQVIQRMFRNASKPIMDVSTLIRVKKKQIVREAELQAERSEQLRQAGAQRRLKIQKQQAKQRRLELLRKQVIATSATKIQHAYRGYLARLVMFIVVQERKKKVRDQAATTIQKNEQRRQRFTLQEKRKVFYETLQRKSATRIQAHFRGHVSRKVMAKKRQGNIKAYDKAVHLPRVRTRARRHSLVGKQQSERKGRRFSYVPRPQQLVLPVIRRDTPPLTREELKLKSPHLGDTF